MYGRGYESKKTCLEFSLEEVVRYVIGRKEREEQRP